jgi:iron complex transport system substrate-binding protein
MSQTKTKKTVLFLLLSLFFLGGVASCKPEKKPDQTKKIPERLISLAPNITETVYLLGLGEKLVGDTTACTYPPEARSLPKVGGFGQFNYEAILALHPDLVLVHKEYTEEQRHLRALGLRTLQTGTFCVKEILESIQLIGETCGASETAEQLLEQMKKRIYEVQTRAETLSHHPRVLVCFGDEFSDVFMAFGPQCLHGELLEMAGGENVVEAQLPFARLSLEAIIRLNPEIIIELLSNPAQKGRNWNRLLQVDAVQKKQIYQICGDYTCIPGPRFLRILEDFSDIITPLEKKP